MQVHFTGFHPTSQTPIHSKRTGDRESRKARIWSIGGFTLVELMVAMVILSLMGVLMLSMVSSTQNLWKQNASRTEQFREARRAFERINERLAQATLNVYWDYVDASGNPRSVSGFSYTSGTFVPKSYFRLSELRYIQTGGTNTNVLSLQQYLTADSYPNTGPRGGTLKGGSVFFQAPIGQSTNTGMNSLLNTVGFFIEQGSDISMQPTPFNPNLDPAKAKIRFRAYEMLEPSENLTLYSLTSGSANYKGSLWFTKPLANTANSHRLADNIVALLFRADYTDKTGNSASSFGYTSAPQRPLASLSPLSQPIEENNLPPNIHVTMVAVDEISGRRIKDLNITLPDPQYDTTDPANPVDPADPHGLPYFEKQLLANHLNYRKFESTVKIGSSKWSTK